MATYSFELWDRFGRPLADISRFASSRSYKLRRNRSEELSFTLDMYEFQRFCRQKLNVHPRTLLNPYQTDVKVKRNGTYLFGTQVIAAPPAVTSGSATIRVTARGYLNLLLDRYATFSRPSRDYSLIALDLITTEQAKPNGDLGITLAGDQYLTGKLGERNYDRMRVADELQRLASLTQAGFDFQFAWNKEFRIVKQLGARRSDIRFVHGGPDGNVDEISDGRTGTSLYNYIYGVGYGFGADALKRERGDLASMMAYYRRERIAQFNSVKEQTTLDENVLATLASQKDLLVIPKLSFDGRVLGDSMLTPGDRIDVATVGNEYIDNINGVFRVEEVAVALDDNDAEKFDVSFDDWGVDQDELATV